MTIPTETTLQAAIERSIKDDFVVRYPVEDVDVAALDVRTSDCVSDVTVQHLGPLNGEHGLDVSGRYKGRIFIVFVVEGTQ